MSHLASASDVSADLQRCILASFSHKGFESTNFSDFFTHAMKDLKKIKQQLNKQTLSLVEERLRKAKDSTQFLNKRREDLLTAAMLLQG